MKNHELSRQASFLAKNSANWAADLLTLSECVSDPVHRNSVERYLAEMRHRLNVIERMAKEAEE